MLDTIKKKLFFYSPLFMCLFIGIMLYMIGGSTLKTFILPLLAMYLVMRYYWRKYLKKTGQFYGNGFGLWGVFFTVVIGIILLRVFVVPEKQEFVSYHSEHPSPQEKSENANLKEFTKRFFDQIYVCGYLTQEKQVTECKTMTTVELDDNPETYEVLILDNTVQNCRLQPCKLLLGQMTRRAIEMAKSNQANEIAAPLEGKSISSWEVSKPDVQINPEMHNGWYKLELTVDGATSVWEYNQESEKYISH